MIAESAAIGGVRTIRRARFDWSFGGAELQSVMVGSFSVLWFAVQLVGSRVADLGKGAVSGAGGVLDRT